MRPIKTNGLKLNNLVIKLFSFEKQINNRTPKTGKKVYNEGWGVVFSKNKIEYIIKPSPKPVAIVLRIEFLFFIFFPIK